MSHRLTECVNDLLSLMRERFTLTIRFACCQTISARDASREDMRCRQRHDETTGRVEEVVGSTVEEWGGGWGCGSAVSKGGCVTRRTQSTSNNKEEEEEAAHPNPGPLSSCASGKNNQQ